MNSRDFVSEDLLSLLLGFDVLQVLDQVFQLLRWHAQEKCVESTLKGGKYVFHYD
jgi:hypothetical protein